MTEIRSEAFLTLWKKRNLRKPIVHDTLHGIVANYTVSPIKSTVKVFVTSDINWESKIDHAMKVLDLRSFFENRDYGSSVTAVGIVFMCRDPALKFKQRIRFSKKEREFSMDIMLHLPDMLPLSHAERRRILADRLVKEVPERLRRYCFPDFNYAAFESDWTEAVTGQLLGQDAARFDHLCKPQATVSG